MCMHVTTARSAAALSNVLAICAALRCGKLWAILLQQGLGCIPRAVIFAVVKAL